MKDSKKVDIDESEEQDSSAATLSYTDASRELDEIVGFFEQRDVDVDQLVDRLQRATAIVEELDRRIRLTKVQVEELVPRLQAASGTFDQATDVEGLSDEQDLADEDQAGLF